MIGCGQERGVICSRVVTSHTSVDGERKRKKENEKKENCNESVALKDI